MLNSRLIICFVGIILSFWSLNCMALPGSPQKPVLEVVIFHTKPQVSPKTLLIAANKVTPILQSMPGFISRTVAKGQEASEWIDIVKWVSLKQALLSAKIVIKKPEMRSFISLMSDYNMYHFSIEGDANN